MRIKVVITCLILLITLQLNAQTAANKQKPESNFTIDGYGKEFKNGDPIYLQYRTSTGVITDSTRVSNGHFIFTGKIKDPVSGGIYRNINPLKANTIPDSFSIYLEPGHIKLGSADTLRNSTLSGTPLNNDQMNLYVALLPYIKKLSAIADPDDLTIEQQKNLELVRSINEQRIQIMMDMAPVKLDFIDNHPKSLVSLINLADLSRNNNLLPAVERSFSKLGADLKKKTQGLLIADRIVAGKKITVGMKAKEFSQPDRSGKMIKLSDYKGQYVLLDFWASWCLPCRNENKNVLALYKKYHNNGFAVLSVSIDSKKAKSDWLKAIKEDGLIWTQVADLKGSKNDAAVLYGVTTIPANVLIDPKGIIIGKDLKGKALNDVLSGLFDRSKP